MTIQEHIDTCHAAAVEKGFWEGGRNSGEVMALTVSEVMEGLEGHRRGDGDNLAEEMADTLIRLFDWCGGFNIAMPEHDKVNTLSNIVRDMSEDGSDVSDLTNYEMAVIERGNLGELFLHLVKVLLAVYMEREKAEYDNSCGMSDDASSCGGTVMDAIYLLCFICKKFDIDVVTAIDKKMEYNKTRPYKHGKSY